MREKLSELRVSAGYTQYSIASMLGISRSHYSQIEGGKKSPSFKLGLEIKLALHYTNDDIYAVTPKAAKRGRPYKCDNKAG